MAHKYLSNVGSKLVHTLPGCHVVMWCRYHDCFMDDVYINIVMEYCNAGDLAGLIKSKAGRHMPESEVMSLFVQVCTAHLKPVLLGGTS